jgi:pimeloyl-ACP methyl ester carboxylesterase
MTGRAVDLQHHRLGRPNGPVHYWLGGDPDGPALVFTHGAAMDHHMFDAQLPAFADHRLLVWDVPGHGESQPRTGRFDVSAVAGDLLAVLDDAGIDRAVLVGQSLGGHVAQHAYLRAPDRVRAMVLIGATSIARAYTRAEVLALRATVPLLALWPYRRLTATVARSLSTVPEVREYALATMRRMPRRGFLAVWGGVSRVVGHRGLPGHRIEVPLLLVNGEHDDLGSIARHAAAWAAAEPRARLEVLPGAGHNANQDDPAAFNRVLREFLQARPAPPDGRKSPGRPAGGRGGAEG